jgi:transposase
VPWVKGIGYVKTGYDRRRKGFNADGTVACKGCFDKDREVDRLKEELRILKARFRYQDKKGQAQASKSADALPFGENTPSSKIPHKRNSSPENRAKKGGAELGHVGHGRARATAESADEVVELKRPDHCGSCDLKLLDRDTRERTIVETVGMKAKEILYRCKRGICPGCLKIYSRKPKALPRALYGNGLLAQTATLHYVHGVTYGKLEQMLGPKVKASGLMEAFHRLGDLCSQALPSLIEQYRQSPVMHADETGWRSDGHSGYAWIFCTEKITLLQIRNTRSGAVAREILGEDRLPGVLVVDRYGGYDRSNCKVQYCFAHLLRKVEALEAEFPDQKEVGMFANRFAPLLSEAMRLRNQPITDKKYYARAAEIRDEIKKFVYAPFEHLGVREIQELFDRAHTRLYHWVKDRAVPAENNRAERELRPTVIARKVSFGSQSDRGCRTRSSIMSVLLTAKKRHPDKPPEVWLKEVLDQVAARPKSGAELLLRALE